VQHFFFTRGDARGICRREECLWAPRAPIQFARWGTAGAHVCIFLDAAMVEPEAVPGPEAFPSTRWPLVRRAGGDHGAPDRRQALEELLRHYLKPLRRYLVRVRRIPAAEADDLLQEFLSQKVLEQNLIGRADPARGRFRSFLLKSLNWFVTDRLRQGRNSDASLSNEGHPEPMDGATGPDRLFDVEWGRQVLSDAVERMRRQCVQARRADVWAVFEARVLGPTLGGVAPVSLEQLAWRLRLRAAADVSNLLVTAKRMFGRNLRAVVAEYLHDPQGIEDELADLRAAMSYPGYDHGTAWAHLSGPSED
jgi:RNA polymerase sigma-70 factor (ECF subfamily)